MRNLILLAVLAAGAGLVFVIGPNVLMGGPSKSEIERVSREIIRATAPSPELAAAAEAASVTPKGLCNKQDAVFACSVEMQVPGAAASIFIAELRKDQAGNWVAAQ
ncbi:hypothetical protein [Szabonella alba]|uniref:Uncharacterized protein n=1 Tax=Szabonella alba TaxID=2804194 RepID=A0A8K0VAQ8_9RHOB|nr:hypothetical protein [Szabonella alba]MBL4917526.1 hypothetical protein [Szabonella alba]